jgi:uncharacterized Zn finger protein
MIYGGWRPYVTAATRRAAAGRSTKKLRGRGLDIEPIEIQGRKIARTFWGENWCTHLERFSDYSNRLPRGRTYVRNGSVCHLAIRKGEIEAIVAGSELYQVTIRIAPLPPVTWENILQHCAGRIGSMLELLQGYFSNHVMEIVTDPVNGMFPGPADIELHCNCPDWAIMCKHVAAVLYGVGARLDKKPELLFVLRQVDHEALISAELDMRAASTREGKRRRLVKQNLSDVFGIDIEDTAPPTSKRKSPTKTARRTNNKKPARNRAASGRMAIETSRSNSPPEKKTFAPTGTSVARLRKRFAMTRSQFADMIGVCPQTVANWENKRGKLALRERTLSALRRAASQMRT